MLSLITRSPQLPQIIPGSLLSLDVNRDKVNWEALGAEPTDKMYISLDGKQAVYRQEIMMLELLSNLNDDNWERPIHFATSSFVIHELGIPTSLNGLISGGAG